MQKPSSPVRICLDRSVLALAALAGGLAAPNVWAADNANAPGRAQVVIPSTLVNLESLDFGPIVTQDAGGTVTINPSTNTSSKVGNVVIVGSTAHRAVFRAQAPLNTLMIMSGDPSVILTRLSGTETMSASLSYVAGPGLTGALVFGLPIGQRATATDQYFYVGGSLTVQGNQAPGLYEGTFTLSVAYL